MGGGKEATGGGYGGAKRWESGMEGLGPEAARSRILRNSLRPSPGLVAIIIIRQTWLEVLVMMVVVRAPGGRF